MPRPRRKPDKKDAPAFAPLTRPLDELPARPGRCRCLKCTEYFKSGDVVRNRICPACDPSNRNARLPRVHNTHLSSDAIPND